MMSAKLGVVLLAVLIAPAVAALTAIVSAQEGSSPSVVTGETLTCPNGVQVQSRFSLEGDAWEVTGILQTGLTGTVTVSGPTGDVTVTPTVNLVISGDPQTGQPVTMAGSTAMTGEMVATSIVNACSADATDEPTDAPTDQPTDTSSPSPEATPGGESDVGEAVDDDEGDDGDDDVGICNRGAGHAGDLLMHVNGGGVHIQRGTVTSFDGEALLVVTPEGSVVVLIDDDTHLNGNLFAAEEVKVRGDFDELGQVVADEVKVLCPHTGGSNSGNEDEDGDDGDEDDDGNGNGNGNRNRSGNHDKKQNGNKDNDKDKGDD